jgi:hypothetical protein
VTLRVEEHLNVVHVVGARALEIGEGEIVEILLDLEHRHALVVEVEKVLQVAELVGAPHRLDRFIRQLYAVARGQCEHHFGLEAALDVDVQFTFGKASDERRALSGLSGVHSNASCLAVTGAHPSACPGKV